MHSRRPQNQSSTSQSRFFTLLREVRKRGLCEVEKAEEASGSTSPGNLHPLQYLQLWQLPILAMQLVTLGGFEPPTCGLGNRRSIHLSYRANIVFSTTYIQFITC